MRFKFFRKKKNREEKGTREPIIVRIFKDNNETGTVIRLGDQNDEADSANEEKPLEGQEEQSEGRQEKEGKGSRPVRFVPNQKMHTVSVYVVRTVLICLLMAVIVFNLSKVVNGIKNVTGVFAPFIVAALCAFILSPIVAALDRGLFERALKIKNHTVRLALSVVITYVVVIGLIALMMIVLVPQLITSVTDLIGRSKLLYASALDFFDNLEEYLPWIDFTVLSEKMKDAIPEIINYVSNILKTSIPKVLSTSYAVVKLVINILLTIAISIYMICDRRGIARAAAQITYAVLPAKKATGFIKEARECGQIFFGFIIGKTIDSLIIGVICFIAVSVCKLPYPALVAVVVGVTNMIPFFGPFIGAIPIILLYLCINPLDAVVFGIVILAIQQFDGWVLGPMILGDSTGAGPLWVIFGTTAGGAFFGFPGMILGVPVTAVFVHILSLLIEKKLKKKDIEVT